MNDETTSRSDKASARRRLIRGAFAAPAVLTLQTGRAQAVASSLRGLNRQPAVGAFPGLSVNPTDTWIRVPVYQSNGKLVVSGNDVAKYRFTCLGQTVFVGRDAWATATDPSTADPPNGYSTPKLTDPLQYAALRFDTAGNIIGVSLTSSSIGTPVSQSAWTSINNSRAGCL